MARKVRRAVLLPHIVEKMPEEPLLLRDTNHQQRKDDNRERWNKKIGRRRFAFEEDFQRNGKRDCPALEPKGALSHAFNDSLDELQTLSARTVHRRGR